MTRLSKLLSLCREHMCPCAQTSLCSTSQKDRRWRWGPCRLPQATLPCLTCGDGRQCGARLAQGHKPVSGRHRQESGVLISCPVPFPPTDRAFRWVFSLLFSSSVFPNVFISLHIKDSIKFRILTFKRPHGPDMGYYPLSICDSEHSCDFCTCHQLICCVWFIQPWLERVIYRHTFGNSLTSF